MYHCLCGLFFHPHGLNFLLQLLFLPFQGSNLSLLLYPASLNLPVTFLCHQPQMGSQWFQFSDMILLIRWTDIQCREMITYMAEMIVDDNFDG